MQGTYPPNEPKMVWNQLALLSLLDDMGQSLSDLWDALELTPLQRRGFWHSEPRAARLVRLGEVLGVDVLRLLTPFDAASWRPKRRGRMKLPVGPGKEEA